MSPKLASDVVVRRPASLEDKTTLLAAQLEDHGFDQPPTVIGDDLGVWNPARQEIALLGTQSVQFINHGASLLTRSLVARNG